jgi:hypothetical protein
MVVPNWMNGGVWFNFDPTPQLVSSAVAVAVVLGAISTVANKEPSLASNFDFEMLFGTNRHLDLSDLVLCLLWLTAISRFRTKHHSNRGTARRVRLWLNIACAKTTFFVVCR